MAESPATSSFPTSLDSWVTLTDKEDLADVSDINKLKDAMLNVQTELGTDVAGSEADLKTRLAVSIGDDGAVKGNSSYPGSPVGDQLFVRTDEDILYRRNTGNTAWLQIGGGHSRLSSTSMSAVSDSGDIAIEDGKLYRVLVNITDIGTGDTTVTFRVNDTSSSNYHYTRHGIDSGGTTIDTGSGGQSSILLGVIDLGTANQNFMVADFLLSTSATNNVPFKLTGNVILGNTSGQIETVTVGGYYTGAFTPADFQLISTGGTMTGDIYTYEYFLA